MAEEQQVGAVQLGARLHGVSPPVTRWLRIAEQASLAKLHASLQVAFGSSDEHLYTFQIRGWQFGDPARAIELALAGGGVDIPLAAFGFEIGESFLYSNRSRIRDNSRGCILVSASGLAMPCSHHSK